MWNKHKETIRRLYLGENLSCELTMKEMEKVHGFVATKRMYKAKFREWNFFKIIRYPLARKIVKVAKHRGDRPTEVVIGEAVVPLGRVRESYERYTAEGGSHPPDAPTPAGLPMFSLRTPADATSPAGQMRSPAASRNVPRSPVAAAEEPYSTQPWTPSKVADRLVPVHNSSVLGTDWRGMSLAQLHRLKGDAAQFDAEGRTEEAEGLFTTAITGFRHLLSETHSLTVKAAYQLAALYANHDRMADADKVLHWVSENHIKIWGVCSEQTLAHYLRVVFLLQSWNRDEHAEVLVFRITDALQDREPDSRPAPQIPGDHPAHPQSAMENLDEEPLEQIFAESEDESLVDRQLRIADLWVASGAASIEQILSRLIRHCDSNPEQLAVQGLQARCQLIQFYIKHEDRYEANQALFDARKVLAQMISRQPDDNGIPEALLSAVRKLAFLHLDNDEETDCERVLSWVAERLERRVRTRFVDHNPAGFASIIFLTRTALEYQRRSGWKGAKPWIEWAYGISLRVLGPKHSRTQKLEAYMENERCEDELDVLLDLTHIGDC